MYQLIGAGQTCIISIYYLLLLILLKNYSISSKISALLDFQVEKISILNLKFLDNHQIKNWSHDQTDAKGSPNYACAGITVVLINSIMRFHRSTQTSIVHVAGAHTCLVSTWKILGSATGS